MALLTILTTASLAIGHAPSVRDVEEVVGLATPLLAAGFGLGLGIGGLPLWLVMHLAYAREPAHGAWLGGSLTSVLAGLLASEFIGVGGLVVGVLALPSGVAAGWIFMRIAYAPAPRSKRVVNPSEGAGGR